MGWRKWRRSSSGKAYRVLQGFNSDAEYAGRVFHVQTEDGGLERPRVITHLFLRGAVVSVTRSDYAEDLEEPDLTTRIRELMASQHQAMLTGLLCGEWDAQIQSCDPGS